MLRHPRIRAWVPPLLLVLLLPVAAGAQMAPPLVRPPSPAAAPPPPADLSRPPLPAAPAALPQMTLPEGMSLLPGAGYRLSGQAGRGQPPYAVSAALGVLARFVAREPQGRVTILARVAGPADDASVARRNSLASGQAIKAVLESAGLPGTRIDLRPLGRLAEGPEAGADGIDVLAPPGRAVREAASRPTEGGASARAR